MTATICVLREVSPGDSQFVPVSEVHDLKLGETIYSGDFRHQTEKHGPYGSHSRTVCLPTRTPFASEYLRGAKRRDCVKRDFGTGELFVPVEIAVMQPGETIYSGCFISHVERHGPSKSHSVLVCKPTSELTTSVHEASGSAAAPKHTIRLAVPARIARQDDMPDLHILASQPAAALTTMPLNS